MTTYSTGKAARLFGVSIRTLQQWDRDGKLKANRTPDNRRYYTDEQLRHWRKEAGRPSQRSTVGYYRVSSRSQKSDLKNQRLRLEEFCIAKGLPIDEWIEEIGGGLNFKRPRFPKLFDRIIAGEIACLPKLGDVNMTERLRFEGRILSGRVKERAGQWFLTVVVECATKGEANLCGSVS